MDCIGSPTANTPTALPWLPSGSQLFNQLILTDRRILKLIYQEMSDAIVERNRKISWRLQVSERSQRALCDFREIYLVT